MAERPVAVGVIGVKGYGDLHLRECQAHPRARLLAVCDVDVQAAQAAAAKYGVGHVFSDYRDMLAIGELDGAVIATPHFLHHQMTLDALAAGKHVLCEKPLTIKSSHAEELVRVAETQGRILTCDYNLRLTRGVRALREIVSRGQVGEVYSARARLLARWTGFMFSRQTDWRVSRAKAGGGILIGRGCHMIDAVMFILGHPPVKAVWAACHNRLTGFEVDDLATMCLMLENGATVHIEVSYVLHEPDFADQFYYCVYGTTGGASYAGPFPDRPEGGELKLGRCDLATGQWQDLEPQTPTEDAQPTRRTLLGDFVDSILQARPPMVTARQAALVTRLIEAGYESAGTGQVVSVDS